MSYNIPSDHHGGTPAETKGSQESATTLNQAQAVAHGTLLDGIYTISVDPLVIKVGARPLNSNVYADWVLGAVILRAAQPDNFYRALGMFVAWSMTSEKGGPSRSQTIVNTFNSVTETKGDRVTDTDEHGNMTMRFGTYSHKTVENPKKAPEYGWKLNTLNEIAGGIPELYLTEGSRILQPNSFDDLRRGARALRHFIETKQFAMQYAYLFWQKWARTADMLADEGLGTPAGRMHVWNKLCAPYGDGYYVGPTCHSEWGGDTARMMTKEEAEAKIRAELLKAEPVTREEADELDRAQEEEAAMTIPELIAARKFTPDWAASKLSLHPALNTYHSDEDANVAAAFGQMVHDELLEKVDELRGLQRIIHGLNRHAGWWSDLETGQPKERNKGELMMLVVTELAESFEAIRKNLMDDKLPHRKGEEVEIADAIIRLLDYAGGFDLDVAGALLEKLAFNSVREDHTIEHRRGEHGKKV